MKVTQTKIKDCLLLELDLHRDERGYFLELFNEQRYQAQAAVTSGWRQVNTSVSRRNVVRGLHVAPYRKLVTCLVGKVFDVVVDLRPDSETYLTWDSFELSFDSGRQVLVPAHCAHGFMGLNICNTVVYLIDEVYDPGIERAVHWQDKTLNITWPKAANYIISEKDRNAPQLVEVMKLPPNE